MAIKETDGNGGKSERKTGRMAFIRGGIHFQLGQVEKERARLLLMGAPEKDGGKLLNCHCAICSNGKGNMLNEQMQRPAKSQQQESETYCCPGDEAHKGTNQGHSTRHPVGPEKGGAQARASLNADPA